MAQPTQSDCGRLGEERARAASENMRLVDFEAYMYTETREAGQVRYAAVWVENREQVYSSPGALTFNRKDSEFSAIVRAQREAGMMAIDIEEYHVPGCERCFAAIFVENTEHLRWQMWWGQTNAQFAAKFKQYLDEGYRMLAVSSQARFECDRLFLGCAGGEHEAWSVYAGI